MSQRVKVITDSASDISDELAEKLDISIVPLMIRFGDEEFVDRIELTHDAFLAKLKDSPILPSTAAPSPGAFETAFRQAFDEGYTHVVCITISSLLSATFQNAVAGSRFVDGLIDVRVVDSEQCSIAEGLIVDRAARLAAAGSSVAEIVSEAESVRERCRLIAVLDTVENLKKGGRIGKAAAFFGSLLSIRPIIEINKGEVKALGRQRTRAKALTYLENFMKARQPIEDIVIGDTHAPDRDSFLERIRPLARGKEITVGQVGPVVGTHGGYGLLGVAFVLEKHPSTSDS